MGDAGSAQARGLAALEKARPLDKAGRTKEAADLYKVSTARLRQLLIAMPESRARLLLLLFLLAVPMVVLDSL